MACPTLRLIICQLNQNWHLDTYTFGDFYNWRVQEFLAFFMLQQPQGTTKDHLKMAFDFFLYL